MLHEQIQVSDIEREGASDEPIPRFAQQFGRREIGFLNSPGPAEADIRDRREIVKIGKSLSGGFQFSLRTSDCSVARGANHGLFLSSILLCGFEQEFSRSTGHFSYCFRGDRNRFAIVPRDGWTAVASTLEPALLIYAMRHFLSGSLLWMHRFSSFHQYPPE